MSDPTFNTVVLQSCLDRMRAGDSEAENDLIKVVQSRLRALAERMFRWFPNVRPIADADDVFQETAVRLVIAVRKVRPSTTRDFMNLAAGRMRGALIDLARRAKKRKTVSLKLGDSSDSRAAREPAAPVDRDMDEWVEFHEAVDRLPDELREVVGLRFYNGMKQEEIAALLKVSVRTVGRHWADARKKIRRLAEIERECEGEDEKGRK